MPNHRFTLYGDTTYYILFFSCFQGDKDSEFIRNSIESKGIIV